MATNAWLATNVRYFKQLEDDGSLLRADRQHRF